MTLTVQKSRPDPILYRFPMTLENMGPKPVTFNTRGELLGYCRKNKIASGALL